MLLLVFLPHWITHTVKTVSFFMILYLMSAIVKSNHSACSQLHKGQVYIMHVWFRSIYLQCKLSMPISLCVYNQNIFFGQFMQLWHKYKNLLFESVLYVLYFVYYLFQIHALLSKLRSLGYFIALGMRLTYELFLKGMNFLL